MREIKIIMNTVTGWDDIWWSILIGLGLTTISYAINYGNVEFGFMSKWLFSAILLFVIRICLSTILMVALANKNGYKILD